MRFIDLIRFKIHSNDVPSGTLDAISIFKIGKPASEARASVYEKYGKIVIVASTINGLESSTKVERCT